MSSRASAHRATLAAAQPAPLGHALLSRAVRAPCRSAGRDARPLTMSRDDLKVRLAHAQSRGNAQKCAMRARLPPPPAQRTSPQRFPRGCMRLHTEHPSREVDSCPIRSCSLILASERAQHRPILKYFGISYSGALEPRTSRSHGPAQTNSPIVAHGQPDARALNLACPLDRGQSSSSKGASPPISSPPPSIRCVLLWLARRFGGDATTCQPPTLTHGEA